jgi:hypothetical protein
MILPRAGALDRAEKCATNAAVLSYIDDLEAENDALLSENRFLRADIADLRETLALCREDVEFHRAWCDRGPVAVPCPICVVERLPCDLV